MQIITNSSDETKNIAKKICAHLDVGDVICLCGPFGSGKTTFTQGLLEGLSFSGYVHSPAFVIVNKYSAKIPVVHIDLYRVKNENEIFEAGILEYITSEQDLIIVEWAEMILKIIKDNFITINFNYVDENKRILEISAKGDRTKAILEFL